MYALLYVHFYLGHHTRAVAMVEVVEAASKATIELRDKLHSVYTPLDDATPKPLTVTFFGA